MFSTGHNLLSFSLYSFFIRRRKTRINSLLTISFSACVCIKISVNWDPFSILLEEKFVYMCVWIEFDAPKAFASFACTCRSITERYGKRAIIASLLPILSIPYVVIGKEKKEKMNKKDIEQKLASNFQISYAFSLFSFPLATEGIRCCCCIGDDWNMVFDIKAICRSPH